MSGSLNVWTTLAPTNFMPMVQDFLNARLVGTEICRTGVFPVDSGKTIDWPYITDMRVQTYTPGTDLTMDANTSASDTMNLNQSRAVTWVMDPNQKKQAQDKGVQAKMANQAAFQLANDIDQKVLGEGASSAASTITGGVLAAGTLYGKMTDALATLQRKNANDGELFFAGDPETIALLAQVEVANGFNLADSALSNGFVGRSHAGFYVYNSNNLPTTTTLFIDTEPTATNTFTIWGVTFTFVAAGTATLPGDISLDGGGTVTDTQLIVRTAINGTGSTGASNYIELSVANRRILQNAGVSAAAFGTNASVITGYGKAAPSETFTAATNGFNAAETGSLLFGTKKAISLAMQINPTMASAPNPDRPMEENYALHTLYGKKVFTRDANRLVKMTRTVTAATV
jgi:hypothetical protein